MNDTNEKIKESAKKLAELAKQPCVVDEVDIETYDNEEYQGFKILWADTRGFFGEYNIFRNLKKEQETGSNPIWYGESETMDIKDPKKKKFLRACLEKFIEQVEIIE